MATQRAFAVLILLGCNATSAPGSQPDEDEGEISAAETGSPAIRSVRTDGGSRQIREHELVNLVIRGSALDTTTSVTIGTESAEIMSTADGEVDVTVFTQSA